MQWQKFVNFLSPNDLLHVFRKENTFVQHIKAIGGRFVIITFQSPEVRDEIIKEEWLSTWFESIHPWSGESAKEERFAWLSCYGMPLNGWSIPNFKLIGDFWGEFLKVDDNTLYGDSFERGRILIATEQTQRITGTIQMEILGLIYSVRIEEDESFRTITLDSFPTESPVMKTNNNSEEREANDTNLLTNAREENVNALVNNSVDVANSEETVHNNEEADFVEEVEVVDETPGAFIEKVVEAETNREVVVHNNPNGLQMVVFKPMCRSWINLMQPKIMMGRNSKVGSPKIMPLIINDKHNSNPISSHNSFNDIAATQIVSSKVNNLENDSTDVDHFSSWSELPFNSKLSGPSKKQVAALKIKKRKKKIEDLIGFPKPKKGGRKTKKGVLLRSAIASAALSISSDGIKNRNRLILNEVEAAQTVSKIIGEDFLGDDDEVISNLMANNL